MDTKPSSQRIDPFTGETFTPKRSNQRFANRKNQYYFNNRKAALNKKEKAKIDKPLDKNRMILKRILGNETEIIKSKDYLLGAGYNLNYFTHQGTVMGAKVDCLYEFVIMKVENQNYKICKSKS